MYQTTLRIFAIVSALLVFQSNSLGGLVISTSPSNPEFGANSGVQHLDVSIYSDNSPVLGNGLSLVIDFSLDGGAVFDTPNAGTFGGVNFLGNGNINFTPLNIGDPPPSSFLSAGSSGFLSIEFNSSQAMPTVSTLFARLNIDTTGLAVGTYGVNVDNVDFGLFNQSGTVQIGSFQITAVPEPNSIALLATAGAMGAWVRKRRLAKKSHP